MELSSWTACEGHSDVMVQSLEGQPWVARSKFLKFPEPQFPLLQNGYPGTSHLKLLRGLKN